MEAEKIKRLEAQNQVLTQKVKELMEIRRTLEVKASKWEISKAAGSAISQIKIELDNMIVDGMTLSHQSSFQKIRELASEFMDQYGKGLS